MTPRSRLRRLGRLGAAAAALVALSIGVTGAAGAIEGEAIRYEAGEGNTVEKTYDTPMAGYDPYPLVLGVGPTPDECATLAYCTLVPIEVVPPPGAGENDDWIMYITVEFEGETIYQQPGIVTLASSDLDLFVYTELQVTDADGEPQFNEDGSPEMADTEIARSATGDRPETIKLFRPENGHYDLVVTNAQGATPEFLVRLEFFDTSFELFDPLFDEDEVSAPPAPASPPAATGAPSRSSPAISDAPASEPAATTLDLAPVGVDEDFAAIESSDLDEQLAGSEPAGSLFRREDFAPPAPVSGSTVALWMGLLPVALLAVVAALFVKFRPAALSFQLPKRG